jgi:hypothetical protein
MGVQGRKSVTGRETGRREKKMRHRLKCMDDVEFYEEYGCKEVENKSFGQDRMDI